MQTSLRQQFYGATQGQQRQGTDRVGDGGGDSVEAGGGALASPSPPLDRVKDDGLSPKACRSLNS